MSDTTPMMRQYQSIKAKHRDCILLYRLGDFYEMFFDDAKKASQLLDLTLTSRNKNQEDSVPLCGIPYHAAQSYINKLLAMGHKVAICEQTEDPKQAQGIVKREVTQILSPGLVFSPDCLEGKSHNYLASLFFKDNRWGVGFVDISTGLFKLTEMGDPEALLNELLRLEPKEILLSADQSDCDLIKKVEKVLQPRLNLLAGWHFDADFIGDLFQRYYQVDVDALGLMDLGIGKIAGGAILSYLSETKLLGPHLLSRPVVYQLSDTMLLDQSAKKNLELIKTISDENRHGSLIALLDKAQTSMGSRMLKEWLLYPLIHKNLIEQRLDSVEEFVSQPEWLARIREHLSSITDIERIQNRILAGVANARDLSALSHSLAPLSSLKSDLNSSGSYWLKLIHQQIDPLEDVGALISKALVEEPPIALKEGNLIRQGYSQQLDELRHIEMDGKSFISSLEATERQRTGISSLKIRYNRVFGYYLEVTHTHAHKVPEHYMRKQTLTSAERYITPELKEYEDKVLGASEKIKALEYELFNDLRQQIANQSLRIKKLAFNLACLDSLASLAYVALSYKYTRPLISDECLIEIIRGRHPVIESFQLEEAFVPNDIFLNHHDCRLMIITGPNMAGKSTIMRQTALITIMAQMGSFVPAESATIGIVDRIFTRIGASDHLQKGLSTFMVEMLETSQILSQATERSLILLDEIGRGTSTFDGLSIAWAVAETIHDQIKARTLFATHYHELTDLSEEKKSIQNFHMSVKEWNGQVRFLRELKQGATNRSYGVFVAAMAGLPSQTIARARVILKLLEEKDTQFCSKAIPHTSQISLFESKDQLIIHELKNIDPQTMTPLEALNILDRLVKMF